MEASQPLRGKSTHQGVEVVCTRKAAFSWGSFRLSLRGRETEPVTMQLKEPEVNTTMPSNQVNRPAARLERMMPFFFTMMSTKPSMPPERSIMWIRAPISSMDSSTMVLPLLAKVFTRP